MYSADFIEKMSTDGAIIGYAGDFWFPDGVIRNHTGVGNVVIGGQTYFGVGELGSIGSVESIGDANPATLEVSLVGIPSTVFNSVMSANIRGSNVTIYKVVYDQSGLVLAAAAVVVGQVTNYSWEFSDTGAFSLEIGDEFTLYERPLQKFYTQSNWLADHEGDNFWQYVAQLSDREIYWGNDIDAEKFTKNN